MNETQGDYRKCLYLQAATLKVKMTDSCTVTYTV